MKTRRRFITQLLAGAAAAPAVVRAAGPAAPSIELRETRVISRQTQDYHGWPTVTRRRNGDLWLVWSGGREGHICPFPCL